MALPALAHTLVYPGEPPRLAGYHLVAKGSESTRTPFPLGYTAPGRDNEQEDR